MSPSSPSWWKNPSYRVPGAIAFVIISLYASLTILIGFGGTQQQPQLLPVRAHVWVSGERIDLEVPQTPQQRAKGMMYRANLADTQGMLFEFSSPQLVKFWMKNVKVPLDMIFLRKGKIVAIAANCPPCSKYSCPTYGPQVLIDKVIEIKGGRAAELGLKLGDFLKLISSPASTTRVENPGVPRLLNPVQSTGQAFL